MEKASREEYADRVGIAFIIVALVFSAPSNRIRSKIDQARAEKNKNPT
jgi:hypothetical protein